MIFSAVILKSAALLSDFVGISKSEKLIHLYAVYNPVVDGHIDIE